MIVIHAIWEHLASAQLHLWAEAASPSMPTLKRAATKQAKQAKAQTAQQHPFALAHQPFIAALPAYGAFASLKDAATSTLTLRLPSTTKGPQPSPELILTDESERPQPTEFKSWNVATLALRPQQALDFLLALPEQPPHGMAFASSLRFWIEAAKFSLELITKQSFAPALQEFQSDNTTSLQTDWEVVLTGEDNTRTYQLSTFMPPTCWAYLPPEKRVSSAPQHILEHFLNHTLDAFIRQSLSSTILIPARPSRRPATSTPLPEQWLQALASENATLTAPPKELHSFSSAMHSWLNQLKPVAANAPFRTCFRLDPPSSQNGKQDTSWHVSYYLQANDDRSLLVPADQVWKERSSTLTFLKRQFENPQERLLADLGKASRLFPAIEESLRTARPTELSLNTEEAYTFLRQSVPLLEQSGFGVLVPTWWQKPSARLRVKLKVKPKEKGKSKIGAGLFGLDSIVSYNWTVAVGDTTLSAKEFEKLVRLKMPLIQVRGQWVELRPEEIEQAIAFFSKQQGNGDMTLGEALRLGLGQEQSAIGLPVADIESEGWIAELMDKLSNNVKISTIKQPTDLQGQLRPYQLKGVSWLAYLKQFGFGACLADDMGLGKCLSADSLIVANGMLHKAEDIWSRYAGETIFDGEGHWTEPTAQLLTNSIDETTGKIVQAPIKRLYRQQVNERLRKIRLQDGSCVTITSAHKLLTDKGWTNDFHIGDYVCVPAKLIWDGKPEDPDLVKFLAWQIAERIPDFIMQADLDSVRLFLSNFFEAEASVVSSMMSIEISTASPVLIQQLSCLLRRFGIWMHISTKQKRATNGAGIFRPYHFGVLGGNAARKFCQAIGFVSERKQQKLEKICEFMNNTNVEGIPASEIMATTVSATNLPIRHFGMGTVYVTGSQQFSPISLKQVIATFDSILSGEAEQAYREKPRSKWTVQTLAAYAQLDKQMLTITRTKLQHLVDQEVYYCRIKEIEEVQYDGWVYDFEIEDYHNFVADNILCHNTIQLISLLLHDRERASNQNPTLIICPMSIVGNWHREIQRFAPSLSVMIHHGSERLADQAFEEEAKKHDVVITTYALALRDKEHLSFLNWEYIVLDEAQNIKNEAAKQTKAIRSLNARYKIALTGTPVENRLSELWSIMEFLNPNYLGSAQDFRQSFALPIEKYHDANRAETLKRLIQPFVLRRLKTDKAIIHDLPDKMEMKVFCNLTQEQASLYEAVVKEMIEKIENSEGIERKGLILSTLLKLKQVCNHPTQFIGDGSSLPGRSGKLARLEEMLSEALAAGDKALIFSQFAEMGTLLRSHLQETLGYEVLFLHGGTPKKHRDAMVQRFQEDRRAAPIFILSLKAGGVGLNLTAANHVFHFDRWWNPAVENQATDRAFRIGQQKNVQVHKFVCVGTLEERIDLMIEQKKVLAESIVGSGENWLTEMSTDQLKEMFALSREAVGE